MACEPPADVQRCRTLVWDTAFVWLWPLLCPAIQNKQGPATSWFPSAFYSLTKSENKGVNRGLAARWGCRAGVCVIVHQLDVFYLFGAHPLHFLASQQNLLVSSSLCLRGGDWSMAPLCWEAPSISSPAGPQEPALPWMMD